MKTTGKKRRYKGFLKTGSPTKVYPIYDISINQKEIVLSVVAPTILQLV
ncbi:hypothetical protein WIW50_02905 [Flavobacteriaceae bacterium 3-367]